MRKDRRNDELQRVEWIDSLLWIHIRNGLTALATKHFLNNRFYGLLEDERKKIYKTNVANTFLYQANDALIDTSIVNVVEHYKTENKIDPIPLEIPDLEELRKHRIVISHPANITFSDSKVQAFYDENLQYKDPTALRLWRVRETLIKKIAELGSKTNFPNEVTVQLGTAELIHGALAASAANVELAPSFAEVSNSLFPYFKRYQEAVCCFAPNYE